MIIEQSWKNLKIRPISETEKKITGIVWNGWMKEKYCFEEYTVWDSFTKIVMVQSTSCGNEETRGVTSKYLKTETLKELTVPTFNVG